MAENSTSAGSSTFKALKELVQSIWVRRKDGYVLPEDFLLDIPVTPEQVAYLLTFYPFIQLVNTKAAHFYEGGPTLTKVKTGWTVHDYGDAMSASLGMLMFIGGEFTLLPSFLSKDKSAKDGDEGGEGGSGTGDVTLNPGQGTIINQTVNTAYEMIAMAKEKKWVGINIIAGTPLMQWAVWMAALDNGFKVEGYMPDAEALAKRNRLTAVPIPALKKKLVMQGAVS